MHISRILTMQTTTLLFITDDARRRDLISSVRAEGATVVDSFDATSPARKLGAWDQLLRTAHHGTASEVHLQTVTQLPGGVWSWIQHLATLASLGLRVRSLEEPWCTLEPAQAELLRFLKAAHDQQRRDRIRESLRTARGKVGRPRVAVDVDAMAAYRGTHSLRETARQFGIGASTCHRILATHQAVIEHQKTPISGAR